MILIFPPFLQQLNGLINADTVPYHAFNISFDNVKTNLNNPKF